MAAEIPGGYGDTREHGDEDILASACQLKFGVIVSRHESCIVLSNWVGGVLLGLFGRRGMSPRIARPNGQRTDLWPR